MKEKLTNLVIVESPTKAKTIQRFLPPKTSVIASMGHVRDLPINSLGVDIHNHFAPSYQINADKRKIVANLKHLAAEAENIYLASDPDREGEAIAWHIYEILKKNKANFHRITFHEITRNAILTSFNHPEEININKVDAQQARRVLDRIVGYQISPMLGSYLKRRQGISAGRVQSVALRLIVEREREITDFKSEEYWNLEALFQTQDPQSQFSAKLHRLDNKEPKIPNLDFVNELADELKTKATYKVVATSHKKSKQNPKPPFITSTLQQAASSFLSMSTRTTMKVAQELYEGINLGDGAVGLITYMRTDSVNLSIEATDACRNFIKETYGEDYLPAKTMVYRSGKSAQEAHEAIRPTNVNYTPESIKNYLTPQQYKLYKIIWQRFVACQMAPAQLSTHNIDVEAEGDLKHSYLFHAASTKITFQGYRLVSNLSDTDEDKKVSPLPELKQGTPCTLAELSQEQKFTEPPPRFSEATLVKTLEENGIGRPSTYATTVSTILDRDYVAKEKNRLIPTELGFKVNDYLVQRMPELFQVKFTAGMEILLDQIEEGKIVWTDMLDDFYKKFSVWAKVTVVDSQKAKELLDLIPETIQWKESSGSHVYNDEKMIKSLKKQAANNKAFSDKQWNAILSILKKYTDQIPEIPAKLIELGIELPQDNGPENTEEHQEPNPYALSLVRLIEESNVTWNPPASKGKRVFDDRKFFASLQQQTLAGKTLTEAQLNALLGLANRYAQNHPDYAKIVNTAEMPQEKEQDLQAINEIEELLKKFDLIQKWDSPVTIGKRVFNDKDFVKSLRTQFAEKKTLSPKQLTAATKMLVKYKIIEDKPKSTTTEIGIPCPRCQAPLVERKTAKGTFISCSTFPKCRFSAKDIESIHSAD